MLNIDYDSKWIVKFQLSNWVSTEDEDRQLKREMICWKQYGTKGGSRGEFQQVQPSLTVFNSISSHLWTLSNIWIKNAGKQDGWWLSH